MKLGFKIGAAILLVGVFVYWLINHSGYLPYSRNPMQYMPNMHDTPALMPQAGSPLFSDHKAARTSPEGTVSRNDWIYPYDKSVLAENVEKRANPLAKSREVLARGEKLYNTYCVVCHGPKGLGEGYVVPPFPKPPLLTSDKIRDFADSQIFHIITVGQNTMMPYAPQIRVNDRWALIHYVRVLQMAQNPTEEQIKAFEEFVGKEAE